MLPWVTYLHSESENKTHKNQINELEVYGCIFTLEMYFNKEKKYAWTFCSALVQLSFIFRFSWYLFDAMENKSAFPILHSYCCWLQIAERAVKRLFHASVLSHRFPFNSVDVWFPKAFKPKWLQTFMISQFFQCTIYMIETFSHWFHTRWIHFWQASCDQSMSNVRISHQSHAFSEVNFI